MTNLTVSKEIQSFIEDVKKQEWEAEIVSNENGFVHIWLSNVTPIGLDFGVYAKGTNYTELIDGLYDSYMNYDISQETYEYLDNRGHGINGAPYDLEDVLAEIKDSDDMIQTLYLQLGGKL